MNKTISKIFLFILMIGAALPVSAKKKAPDWITKAHWQEGVHHYFVGVSSRAPSEEVGRREAYDNAMAEAIQSLFGVSGKMSLASYANLQKIQISQDVFVSTDEVQLKAEPVDLYTETKKEEGRTYYTVYRSVKVSDRDAKRELERLKQAATKKESVEGKVLSPESGLTAVTVDGVGVVVAEDEPSAKANAVKNGIANSCQRLLKEWFYEKTLSENYPKLEKNVYGRCGAFSKKYDVNSGFREENVYKVNMTVYLKKDDIRRALMDIGLYREKVPAEETKE